MRSIYKVLKPFEQKCKRLSTTSINVYYIIIFDV